MKVICSIDCTEDVRKALILKLTTLFVGYELEKLKQYFSEDIGWTLVGEKPIWGKEKFLSVLAQHENNKAIVLIIDKIIVEDNLAAINGTMTMQDEKRFGFSDIYSFADMKFLKVEFITSYVSLLDSKQY